MGCGDRESEELRVTLGAFLEQPGRWERRVSVGCGVTKSSALGKWRLKCLLNTHMGVSYRQLAPSIQTTISNNHGHNESQHIALPIPRQDFFTNCSLFPINDLCIKEMNRERNISFKCFRSY